MSPTVTGFHIPDLTEITETSQSYRTLQKLQKLANHNKRYNTKKNKRHPFYNMGYCTGTPRNQGVGLRGRKQSI